MKLFLAKKLQNMWKRSFFISKLYQENLLAMLGISSFWLLAQKESTLINPVLHLFNRLVLRKVIRARNGVARIVLPVDMQTSGLLAITM